MVWLQILVSFPAALWFWIIRFCTEFNQSKSKIYMLFSKVIHIFNSSCLTSDKIHWKIKWLFFCSFVKVWKGWMKKVLLEFGLETIDLQTNVLTTEPLGHGAVSENKVVVSIIQVFGDLWNGSYLSRPRCYTWATHKKS